MSESQQIEVKVTKTVSSYFGDRQVTRDEFINQWSGQCSQFFAIAGSSADCDEIATMRARIETLAGKRWDDLKG